MTRNNEPSPLCTLIIFILTFIFYLSIYLHSVPNEHDAFTSESILERCMRYASDRLCDKDNIFQNYEDRRAIEMSINEVEKQYSENYGTRDENGIYHNATLDVGIVVIEKVC